MLPLVSIIIPTYNRAHCLARCLESVMQQTYPALECIVIDDGSDDNTNTLVSSQFPAVTLVRQKHAGVSAARNHGIRRASGSWLALLDSDDCWQPSKISQQINCLKNSGYKICHTNEIWIRDGKRINTKYRHLKQDRDLFAASLNMCVISPSSVFVHRSLFNQIGLFDEALPACEDYDFWLRVTDRLPVLYIDEPLTIKFGGHSDQLSKKYWGIDRFRVESLKKLIDSHYFESLNHLELAKKMLVQKAGVLLHGAKKRSRTDATRYYEYIVNRYNYAEYC